MTTEKLKASYLRTVLGNWKPGDPIIFPVKHPQQIDEQKAILEAARSWLQYGEMVEEIRSGRVHLCNKTYGALTWTYDEDGKAHGFLPIIHPAMSETFSKKT